MTRLLTRFMHIFSSSKNRQKEYFARKLIGYSQEQMWSVVSDVKNYKHFVPFCRKSTVLYDKVYEMAANLEIGFPPVSENYTSQISLEKPNKIQAICRDGRLFNYLETTWKFSPGLSSNEKSCIVDFYICFEFKSVVHSSLAQMFFDALVKQMEGAFICEAAKRFGKESLPVHPLTPEGR